MKSIDRIGAFCIYCGGKLKDREVAHELVSGNIEFTSHCSNCNHALSYMNKEIILKKMG